MNTVIGKLSYNGHSHQGANQAMLHKRNIANVSQTQYTASLRLNSSLFWGKRPGSQEPKSNSFEGLFSVPDYRSQVCPGQRHRLAFPLPFHQGC